MTDHENMVNASPTPDNPRERTLESASGFNPMVIRAILGEEPIPSYYGHHSWKASRAPALKRRHPTQEPRHGDSEADMNVAGKVEELPLLAPEDQADYAEIAHKWAPAIKQKVSNPEKTLDSHLRRSGGDPRLVVALSAKDNSPESQTLYHKTAEQRREARRARRRL